MDNNMSAYTSKIVAYLEKYKIYDLFKELITRLIIASPENPLLFIKSQFVNMLQSNSNKMKIVLLVPGMPKIDKLWIAQGITERLGIVLLSRADIIEYHNKMFGETILDADLLAHAANEKLKTCPFVLTGWIMIDYPQTMQEALSLQKNGILPKCTIYLKNCDQTSSHSFSNDFTYRKFEMKNIFKTTFKEINTNGRTPDQIVSACCEAAIQTSFSGLPIVYRVILLGPPGCGVDYQAAKIATRFKLVTVDFEYLLRQSVVNDTELGKRIQNKTIDLSDIKNVLYGKLKEKDCLENGWILINFPKNVKELELIDSFETPPNRIIFFNITKQSNNALILSRKLKEISQYAEIIERKMLEMTDEYFMNVAALMLYCGKTAIYIDATKSAEIIEMAIQEGIMTAPARYRSQ